MPRQCTWKGEPDRRRDNSSATLRSGDHRHADDGGGAGPAGGAQPAARGCGAGRVAARPLSRRLTCRPAIAACPVCRCSPRGRSAAEAAEARTIGQETAAAARRGARRRRRARVDSSSTATSRHSAPWASLLSRRCCRGTTRAGDAHATVDPTGSLTVIALDAGGVRARGTGGTDSCDGSPNLAAVLGLYPARPAGAAAALIAFRNGAGRGADPAARSPARRAGSPSRPGHTGAAAAPGRQPPAACGPSPMRQPSAGRAQRLVHRLSVFVPRYSEPEPC